MDEVRSQYEELAPNSPAVRSPRRSKNPLQSFHMNIISSGEDLVEITRRTRSRCFLPRVDHWWPLAVRADVRGSTAASISCGTPRLRHIDLRLGISKTKVAKSSNAYQVQANAQKVDLETYLAPRTYP